MEEKEQSKTSFSREVFDWIQTIAVAVVSVVIIFTFIIRIVQVEGPSMTPTLLEGERVVVSEIFYTPKVGDVVVVCVPGRTDPFVKRIIAMDGDVVDFDFEKNRLVINGEPIEEEYINEEMSRYDWYRSDIYPVTVGKNQVFVCGDNRNHSTDSRYETVGCIDKNNIMGRVVFILTPLNKFGVVK